MVEIMDAPDIRRAEMNGIEDPDPIICPCCHQECDNFFVANGDVLGCEHCITVEDAANWMMWRE